jgi:hypothetical protein
MFSSDNIPVRRLHVLPHIRGRLLAERARFLFLHVAIPTRLYMTDKFIGCVHGDSASKWTSLEFSSDVIRALVLKMRCDVTGTYIGLWAL